MAENRDEYSGKRKVKGVVCSKAEKGHALFGRPLMIRDKETI